MTTAASLISGLAAAITVGEGDHQVTAVCQDSRAVVPGAVFVAVPGTQMDGHAFLRHALAEGARTLVVQQDRRGYWEELRGTGATLVSVPDTRVALGCLAAAFHGFPARDLHVVGVTGTDGKTTTSLLAAGVLEAGGIPTAVLCTAGQRVGGTLTPNSGHLTTPDAVGVQAFLARARDAGARCAIIEATSHGLHQERLAHAEFDVGVLTSLSRDHLDYHGSVAAYLRAKARLFEMLDTSLDKGVAKTAVLNRDEPAARAMAAATSARQLHYGLERGGDISATQVALHGWRSSYLLQIGGPPVGVRLPLPGRFNIGNSLAAAGVGVAFGLDAGTIRRGLESVTTVPGRMERIDTGLEFPVVVDYAHNPHELSQVLSFLRQVADGRLIAVFGCAGDRDPGRRRAMGRVAARLADYTVVTSEDSWTEPPEEIAAGVERGLAAASRQPDRDYVIRLDRREAIAHGMAMAKPGDVVLVAGMGHERAMATAAGVQPWDDRRIVRELAASPKMAPI